MVRTVQKFTKPIQPFIDIFQTPVPILSAFDSSETVGTLLLKGAGTSSAQLGSFKLMVQIINAVNAIVTRREREQPREVIGRPGAGA